MDGRRRALIVASDEYDHPGLSRLRAPAADAEALASVLGDAEVGGFQVDVVHNEPSHVVGGHIEDLFAESRSDDLLLLHFSGHGLKSDSGELFFAARNTRPDRLASTAVPADFVQRCMRSSRARSIVLFLDCCYGGAFGEGVAVRAAGNANVLESFPAGGLGGGRGRAVITASSAMEYAFEGNSLADEHQQQPSVFTAAVVEGLTSGEADRDEDGLISLNELYDYVYDRVRERNPKQTPGRDVELEGDLYLARSRRRRLHPLPIPPDVAAALTSDNVFTRLGAVAELRARTASADLAAALGAYQALVEVSRSDIRYVQDAASEALAGTVVLPDPPRLHFGRLTASDLPVARTIRLGGPPLAGAVTVSQSEAWVTATVEPGEVRVSVDPGATGHLSGSVTLTGPTGQAVVPVTAEVVSGQPAAAEAPPAAGVPLAADVPPGPGAPPADEASPALGVPPAAEASPALGVPPAAEASPAADIPSAEDAPPAAASPAAAPAMAARPPAPAVGLTSGPATDAGARAVPPAGTGTVADRAGPAAGPAAGSPAGSPPVPRQYWKLSGIAALVSGALMLLCVVLPQQWGISTFSNDPFKAAYLLYAGLVLLGLGGLVLLPRWRTQGLGAVIGASPLGTVVVFDMVNTVNDNGTSELGMGFWLGCLAPLVLLAAGVLAVAAARQESELGFVAFPRSDWASWLVLALALAGASTFLTLALDTYSSGPGWSLQGVWVAVLAVCVPLGAVLARPVLLGRWVLIGWCLGCIAPVIGIWLFWENEASTSRGMWFALLTLAAMAGLAPMLHRDRRQVPVP